MRPHLISFVLEGKCARPHFWSATMVGLPRVAPRLGPQTQITNIYQSLTHTACILLRYVNGVGGLAPWGENAARILREFAGEQLDRALRLELDHQLRLMARGENIAANRHRRAMLTQYLMARPSQDLHAFYRVPMEVLTSENRMLNGNTDIVTRQETKVIHEERVVKEEKGEIAIRTEELHRIADQVFSRVERKLRMDKERMGVFR